MVQKAVLHGHARCRAMQMCGTEGADCCPCRSSASSIRTTAHAGECADTNTELHLTMHDFFLQDGRQHPRLVCRSLTHDSCCMEQITHTASAEAEQVLLASHCVCRWEPVKVIKVPESAYFGDYSDMAFNGDRLAITSQVGPLVSPCPAECQPCQQLTYAWCRHPRSNSRQTTFIAAAVKCSSLAAAGGQRGVAGRL